MPRSSSSTELYRHRQFGAVTSFALGAALVFALAVGVAAGWPAPLLVMSAVFAMLLVTFRSLTTIVTDRHVRIALGPGWISRTIPLDEIRSVSPGRSRFYWGWGIRYWPGYGWIWNVSGFDQVVFELTGGREFRVGTDDPSGLVEAIHDARARG